jgi:hypothetical protein
VRQETVAVLGELDAAGRAKARALAQQVVGAARDQQSLFDVDDEAVGTVPVKLKHVRLERGRQFEDVWLGLTLWRALRLDEVFGTLLPQRDEDVPWATMAAVLVMARLSEPSSELHIAEDWYRTTALEDLLGLPVAKVNDDRLGELFDIAYDLLLNDVTSTYFEGLARGNALAKRGYSRDHRPDCVQVCIALVVTRDGLPLGYEIFEGNRTEVTTVEEIVTTMEKRHGHADRIWVVDRGMMSEENVSWLREGGRRYVLATSRNELKRWQRSIVEEDGWGTLREKIEVKLCQGPQGTEIFVLCRSRDRGQKERAMRDRYLVGSSYPSDPRASTNSLTLRRHLRYQVPSRVTFQAGLRWWGGAVCVFDGSSRPRFWRSSPRRPWR